MTEPSPDRIKIIGIGNEWRSDDAVGLLVARRLRIIKPPGVRVLEARGYAASLLASWQGSDKVIMVDAMASGAEPGTIAKFVAHLAPLPAKFFPAGSSHTLGLAQIIEMARALGQMPHCLIVFGVEGRTFALGQELSREVAAAIPRVIKKILAELPGHLQVATRKRH